MRLFIAIDIPEDLKKSFAQLRTDIPGARWVPPEQIHLTLAFLGDVEEAVGETLRGELARIRVPSFTLRPAGNGCFPGVRRPRVLWVGLRPEPRLLGLAAAVHHAVLACGLPLEERPFAPHITLARLKLPAAPEVAAFLERGGERRFPPFPVREFTLFQSRLQASGAQHVPLHTFPLVRAAA